MCNKMVEKCSHFLLLILVMQFYTKNVYKTSNIVRNNVLDVNLSSEIVEINL